MWLRGGVCYVSIGLASSAIPCAGEARDVLGGVRALALAGDSIWNLGAVVHYQHTLIRAHMNSTKET